MRQSRLGFSLVELAAVLVIIGLVIGGVMLGRHMIRASEVNGVLSEVESYKAAFSQFQLKYNGLPGDITDATTYWGTDPNGCTGAYSATRQRETCNGDGNGKLTFVVGMGYREWYSAWQHLANAGMIPGSYTGVTWSGGSFHSQTGFNTPASKIDGAGYTVRHLGYYSSNPYFAANYGHMIYFGGEYTNSVTYAPIITTEEAQNLDTKADDGLPATGSVVTYYSSSLQAPGCATTDVASTAAYATSATGLRCSLIFIVF